jgi:prepilin-type N-terminal cleavage/methylation domain-containing protein
MSSNDTQRTDVEARRSQPSSLCQEPLAEDSTRALPGDNRKADPDRDGERGFTIAEMAVVLMIMAILSVLGIGILNGRIEKAKLARCMIDLRSVQSTLWSMSDGITWPNPPDFWEYAWSGKRPGAYYYLPNNVDANSGHGNDMDICDEENPGASTTNRDCQDIQFVIVCQHDHRNLAKYVYIEDEGPPTLAGWGGKSDPGYDRFIKWIPQK